MLGTDTVSLDKRRVTGLVGTDDACGDSHPSR